jgi:hypothetical protein
VIAQLVDVVAPVFGVALVGWVFAGWRRADLSTVADIVLYLAAPALVFSGLVRTTVDAASLAAVGGGAVVQSLVCGATAFVAFRSLKIEGRGLYLATMFPNTGNLGLPLALFAFGQPGLTAAVIVFVAISLVHYSLGVMIASGSAHPGKVLRMPLVHAAALGIAVTLSGVEPPAFLMRAVDVLGEAAVPLMLLSLGIRMRSVRVQRPWRALLAVFLRMVPGLAAAWAFVQLTGLEGAERGVILVTGVLPSAVMNFVLAEAYGQQSEEVASAILLGTVLSFLAVPAVLAFLV